MYTYTYIFIHTHLSVYHDWISLCVHISSIRMYICFYVYIYVCTYVCIYTCTDICIYLVVPQPHTQCRTSTNMNLNHTWRFFVARETIWLFFQRYRMSWQRHSWEIFRDIPIPRLLAYPSILVCACVWVSVCLWVCVCVCRWFTSVFLFLLQSFLDHDLPMTCAPIPKCSRVETNTDSGVSMISQSNRT